MVPGANVIKYRGKLLQYLLYVGLKYCGKLQWFFSLILLANVIKLITMVFTAMLQ
jgi:hypothetical protein